MMSLAMHEDGQSDEQKQQIDAQRELEIVTIIKQCGIIIYSIIALSQVVLSAIFYWRSRKIKEITFLPKFIMILINIQGVMLSSYYITTEFFKISVHTTIVFFIKIFLAISSPITIGLLIRFERVQVQLRAQEENTIKILAAIKRANTLQVVFAITLIVAYICQDIG